MEMTNIAVQVIIGLIIIVPFLLFIISRIGRLNQLNQTTKSHFDIWRDLQKRKGE